MAYDLIRRRDVPGDWTMGAPIMTTNEDARRKWETLLAAVNALNEDVTQIWGPKVTDDAAAQAFIRQWIGWRDTVYAEYKDNSRRKIIPDMAWSVWNRGDAKVRELEEWRAKFEKLSGRSATAPGPKPEEEHDAKKSETSPWAFLAAGLAGAVVLTLVQRKLS